MATPPFIVSTEAINMIAEISALLERHNISIESEQELKLRKANRVKTIHSSLAIEGNTLSEDEVRDIINGKQIVAPIRQIQEVKNAIRVYDIYSQLDPFKEKNLLKAHGIMMEALTDDAGRYRSGGVGVFGDSGLVHMAPPPQRVPQLMGDLFSWLKNSNDHLLIRSCVFHYEFEFIHPFSDGNGRTGRLWQSLILGKLNPLFEHLPVENMVYGNQQAYYDAISASTKEGQSGPFIDFMLNEILKTLQRNIKEDLSHNVAQSTDDVAQNVAQNVVQNVVQNMNLSLDEKIIQITNLDSTVKREQLAHLLSVNKKTIERHLKALGIHWEGHPKTGHWVATNK